MYSLTLVTVKHWAHNVYEILVETATIRKLIFPDC